jgi:hypothetical protein
MRLQINSIMAQIDDQEFAGQNLAVQELVLQVPIVA